MQVTLDIEDLILQKRSLKKVGSLFGLSDEQCSNPNAGDWIVDQIKQLQQTALLVKSLQKSHTEGGSVEGYGNLNLPATDNGQDQSQG